MATSLRDLLHTVQAEAPFTIGASRQAGDAAGALDELGRALRRLAIDGLAPTRDGIREVLVRDLADRCQEGAVAGPLERAGRLTALAAATADTVSILREETSRDQRWAIAEEVADAVRVVSTYAADGNPRRLADIHWAHLAARGVNAHAVLDPPQAHSRAVLDRAVPQSALPLDLPASRAAMECLIVLSDRLRRAQVGTARRPTLLEAFAATRAAETTVRYGAAAAAGLHGRARPDTLTGAAAAWYEVRERLQPFTTAAPRIVEDLDLGMWAQRAHLELRRAFGSPDQTADLAQHDPRAEALLHLQTMANEIPEIADHLAGTIALLAAHRELYALASKLPFQEYRVTEFLTRQPVFADRFDTGPALQSLQNAAKRAAWVAVDLDRGLNRPVDQDRRPNLLTAHLARVSGVPRLHPADSDAAREVTGGMLDIAERPAEADTGPDLRGPWSDNDPSGPDFDIE